ncbi:MAG: MerR family transcriptional regulator [Hyphomicrobiaceae bacterium]|nr:MerR family transcriptional regulator [Hyphomicrobiaceae bacterium]
MAKAAEAFRTISEVADDLGIQKHVLRFWEVKFSQIRPMKRGGGRRYYRPEDMELLRGIRQLLHRDGYTIKGVQKILREQGVEAVKAKVRSALDVATGPVPEPTEVAAAARPETGSTAARGQRPQRPPVVPPVDRERVLRSIVAELVVCRDILAGRVTATDVSRSLPPRRARRSA